MASSKPILCGPCHKGKVNIKSDIWCYNCDEGLCATCLSHHKRSKRTHDHKTIDVTSYKLSITAIKTECDKHHQQLNLYCASHLMPCCDKCVSTSHSKCTGIKSLTSEVEKTNIEKSMKSVDTDINSILPPGKEVMPRNRYLWDQEKSKATDFISEIEGKLENLKEMKENVHTITENKRSKLQSFLQVHQFQRYVDNLGNNERAKAADITMKQNDEIESILIKLGSLKSFGEVMVVKTEIDLNRETRVRREAQVESREQSNINNMTMNIETKIETNMGKWIKNMICLMDGRVILVDRGGRIILFTVDGKQEKHLPIAGKAWSVTQINQNSIAISFPYKKVT
ncbi:unnamed protein product [Mytilus coruscus]|uniref:B box-type domain-containing protein n=1 Tax=Mytilus coruscus TaxID=42192 RepID=A0A6J8CH43_MYTCO|nr:unnamed protein product [Mytilus coruscus]